ncbi:LacI family DNA-binding transcriptional regulator [Amycolatopsis echigonensis]|uniref:LacI family transcriptional regulator n=1 Tax=Amycolatopsis echigonensis TaxID=2576905 RepID=A0A2N3WSU6_9PSEU|nr:MULTISPECIES: LacI family DNA-binding transcriptional regulator [Amycolatopsis]PKV96932.1 LacI family transcriptional regulator [Amycolatopsis niigatensis]
MSRRRTPSPDEPEEAAGSAATLADVAERAGVSLATASRVLNGSTRQVKEALRAKVLAAAAELDYSPNAQAQAMARGSTATLGLIVHDIADPYFSSIAAGVIAAAGERGLLVTVASTQRDPAAELRHVELLRRQRAQTVLLAGSRVDDPALLDPMRAILRKYTRGGGRAACIGQDGLGIGTVVVENRLSAAALADALYRAGHRRFAVLAGPPSLLTARDRAEGFAFGLSEHGAEPQAEHQVSGEFTWSGGYAAAKALLDQAEGRPPVDCLFAVNDVMALGALAAARDAGLRVPEDIGIAGFDDISPLRDVVPALTTVRLPMTDMGATAVQIALDEPASPPRRHRVRGEVVLRDSTRSSAG